VVQAAAEGRPRQPPGLRAWRRVPAQRKGGVGLAGRLANAGFRPVAEGGEGLFEQFSADVEVVGRGDFQDDTAPSIGWS
jgi:hypothetical protein